jgi:hypothetical protein
LEDLILILGRSEKLLEEEINLDLDASKDITKAHTSLRGGERLKRILLQTRDS